MKSTGKMETRLYAAPMEGLTGFAWRKAHNEVFGDADKYFTPFVVANQTHKFKTKEYRDLSQNEDNLVPQVLTDKADHFIWACDVLSRMGFDEINLNLGCPSPTVVTRGKGSGLLKDIETLDRMLDGIFSSAENIKISIKTRLGYDDIGKWPEILKVYNSYPLSEIIIHTRLRSDFYDGAADIAAFEYALSNSNHLLVYNGDVTSKEHQSVLNGWNVMAGRGLLSNPSLLREIRGGEKASSSELKLFHNRLLMYYLDYMQSDGPVLHHMKSFWVYFEKNFEIDGKVMKKLRKSKSIREYVQIVEEII